MTKHPVELNGSEPPEEAIARLIDAQGGRLYSLGLRFCGNREEAEDLVQETFLLAFRNWSQFQGRSRVTTWLYTIASRVCQRFHRKRAGEPDRLESLDELLPFGEPRMAVVPDDDEGPLAERVRAESRQQLETAIADLPLTFRMPLVLREIVGLSIAEVGEVLGVKGATVKTRIHRARLRIRHALENALPTREVAPARYPEQVCLDLLNAKQEALDRGVEFRFPDDVVCERCAVVFETMDLAQHLCHDIARGELPAELRRELIARLQARP